jgi:alkylation response protein AidB-like acyl-CoA dehydrogenase
MPLKEVSTAKLFCSERLNDIVMRGMRLLGAETYLIDTPMPRRLRESLLAFYDGTVEIQRNTIAKWLKL